jgi:hypothetical protein
VSAVDLYDRARRHGLSHEQALDAVEAGTLTCWCGHADPCPGGAQRHVGCAHFLTGEMSGWSGAPLPVWMRPAGEGADE